MPAAKKHPSTRARRNVASSAAVLSEPSGRGAVPGLPLPREWSELTLEWWRDLWSSPMSSEYHESDRHQLFVLAMLMDDFFTAESRTMRMNIAAEIRLARMAFGMTPYDRRRLEWTIEQAEESKDRGNKRRQQQGVPQPKPGNDPRSVLRAV
jgi:hypothetical protein